MKLLQLVPAAARVAVLVNPSNDVDAGACAADPLGLAPRDPRHLCDGLMSYGTNVADAWRQASAYAVRIVTGAKTG